MAAKIVIATITICEVCSCILRKNLFVSQNLFYEKNLIHSYGNYYLPVTSCHQQLSCGSSYYPCASNHSRTDASDKRFL